MINTAKNILHTRIIKKLDIIETIFLPRFSSYKKKGILQQQQQKKQIVNAEIAVILIFDK